MPKIYPLRFGGDSLPEKAELTFLQDKLREAKRNQLKGMAMLFFSGALGIVGFGVISIVEFAIGTAVGVFGIVCAVSGGFLVCYSSNRRAKLMRRLMELATEFPKCPNCMRNLPKGDLAVCPFCGKSLTGSA